MYGRGSPAAVPHSRQCGDGGGTHAGNRYPAALYEFWWFEYLDVFFGIGAGEQRPPEKVCEVAGRPRQGAFEKRLFGSLYRPPGTWARKRGKAARKRSPGQEEWFPAGWCMRKTLLHFGPRGVGFWVPGWPKNGGPPAPP